MPDDPTTELADLKARRRMLAGIRARTHGDKSTTFDLEHLDKRIAELEREVSGVRTRYAAFSKGLDQ